MEMLERIDLSNQEAQVLAIEAIFELNRKVDALDRKMTPVCDFYSRAQAAGALGRGLITMLGAMVAIGAGLIKIAEWVHSLGARP